MKSIEAFPYLPRIEWESLDPAADIQNLRDLGPLPSTTTQLRLSRSEDYTLEGIAIGAFADGGDFKRYRGVLDDSSVAGTLSKGDLVDGSDEHAALRVDGCYVRGLSTSIEPIGDKFRLEFELQLGVGRFEWSEHGKTTAWLTDWFLNGPHDHVYRRMSSRRGEATYGRRRGRSEDEQERKFQGLRVEPMGFDHFRVESPATNFVVHQVPAPFGPKWSRNLGVEYEPRDGAFPDENTRDAVTELLGFLLGRRLVGIGTTRFDADGFPVGVMARQPWGTDIRSVCSMEDFAPVQIERGRKGHQDVAGLGGVPSSPAIATRTRRA